MSEETKNEDLFSRTWKTVVVLVGACVLFVGALSTTAVLVTNKAMAPRNVDTTETPAETPAAKTPAKKPVSI